MSQTVNEPLAALARQVASATASPSAFEVVARETVTVRGLFGKKQKTLDQRTAVCTGWQLAKYKKRETMNHVPGGWYEEVEYAHLWLTTDGELRAITALETRSLGRLEPTIKIIGNGPATTSDVSALDWTHVVSTWKGTTGNREQEEETASWGTHEPGITREQPSKRIWPEDGGGVRRALELLRAGLLKPGGIGGPGWYVSEDDWANR